MAGHSKWANIKHRKGAQDAKRAKVFARISKAIIVAVQNGGDDPTMNSALKLALEQARRDNMPKDNIERAIKRGCGTSDEDALTSVLYEAYGPGSTAMLIECATDNTNRTVTEIKTILKKTYGKFVPGGGVAFQFERCGEILATTTDRDAFELTAIDAGAIDLAHDGDVTRVLTAVEDLADATKALEEHATIHSSRLTYNPAQTVTLQGEDAEHFDALYDALEDHDDVQTVFTNLAS